MIEAVKNLLSRCFCGMSRACEVYFRSTVWICSKKCDSSFTGRNYKKSFQSNNSVYRLQRRISTTATWTKACEANTQGKNTYQWRLTCWGFPLDLHWMLSVEEHESLRRSTCRVKAMETIHRHAMKIHALVSEDGSNVGDTDSGRVVLHVTTNCVVRRRYSCLFVHI